LRSAFSPRTPLLSGILERDPAPTATCPCYGASPGSSTKTLGPPWGASVTLPSRCVNRSSVGAVGGDPRTRATRSRGDGGLQEERGRASDRRRARPVRRHLAARLRGPARPTQA